MDPNALGEAAKEHILSLTSSLKASRASELKFMEMNRKLMLFEGSKLQELIIQHESEKDAGLGHNSSDPAATKSTLSPAEVNAEIESLQSYLKRVESQISQIKSTTLSYSIVTAIPECKLREGIEQTLYNLKLKHEGEVKEVKNNIKLIEADYLKGIDMEQLYQKFILP